jgi:hypothetical protein
MINRMLTKNIKNNKIHVENVQGRHFLGKKKPADTLHNIAQGWGGGGRGIGGMAYIYIYVYNVYFP